MDDPKCEICGERRSAHLPCASGPLGCPREVRGEGRYVMIHPGYTRGGGAWFDDEEMPPLYEFVPSSRPSSDGGR